MKYKYYTEIYHTYRYLDIGYLDVFLVPVSIIHIQNSNIEAKEFGESPLQLHQDTKSHGNQLQPTVIQSRAKQLIQ